MKKLICSIAMFGFLMSSVLAKEYVCPACGEHVTSVTSLVKTEAKTKKTKSKPKQKKPKKNAASKDIENIEPDGMPIPEINEED